MRTSSWWCDWHYIKLLISSEHRDIAVNAIQGPGHPVCSGTTYVSHTFQNDVSHMQSQARA